MDERSLDRLDEQSVGLERCFSIVLWVQRLGFLLLVGLLFAAAVGGCC